ncbi:hypothetical protein GQ54DRAFT_295791 [Martensiomyces pterosporus]|nr:hypothetical protein GQ54DRAFT_295791 [Martensiomyces pterosporus]
MSAAHVQSADSARSSDWAFKRLFKLESECRSQTPGAQVQAVGQFSKLLDQFPFPTLVSSAFLKLGDLFRSSPNSLRYHIAQVFELSQHHLPRITHTEELLKRILTVLYSNDPVARVLALQLIGNASIVFAKYPEAQHGVLLRYQSKHPLEIAAAVRATECMLKYSPEFLNVVWETVTAKAGDAHILDSVRAQLIHSLQHAAPNLQLSTLLYDHCRTWMSDPDNTIVIKSATMYTWKAILQRHNELRCEDAEYISSFLSLEPESVQHAALGVLGKWRPHGQVSDMTTDDIDAIKDRLTTFAKAQMSLGVDEIDLSGVRLAVMVLARIDSARGTTGVGALCWELTQALSRWSLAAYAGSAPAATTALDFLYDCIPDADESGKDAGTPLSDVKLRCVVSSAMLAINVASILSSPAHKIKAAEVTVQTWRTISRASQPAGQLRYTKRYLKLSWKWCKSTGTGAAVLQAIKAMLDTPSQAIAQAIAAIASEGPLYDDLAAACMDHIASFAEAVGSTDAAAYSRNAAWLSIAVALTTLAQSPAASFASDMRGTNAQAVVGAVSKWAAHVASLAEGSTARASYYASTSPPAHICLTVLSLLAACGCWRALGAFCKALPADRLSSNVVEWIYATSSLAEAECAVENTESYLRFADRSLTSLRILDNQGVSRAYQLSIVQLRTAFVQLTDSWRQFQPAVPPHPSSIYAAKALISRTVALADQANLIIDSVLAMDGTTRGWLGTAQTTLGEIIRTCAVSNGSSASEQIAQIRGAVNEALSQRALGLRLGPSFFSLPPNPSIYIETRPNIEGLESPYTVLSGSQLHLTVEGFVQLPKHKLRVSPLRVRVSTWLSQRPYECLSGDLAMRSKYNTVARQASRPTPNGRAGQDAETMAGASDSLAEQTAAALWDKAIAFESVLDGTYFECACTIPTPELSSTFGQAETNILVHVHIDCALVDSANKVWWIGPHKSYPMVVSTTFAS